MICGEDGHGDKGGQETANFKKSRAGGLAQAITAVSCEGSGAQNRYSTAAHMYGIPLVLSLYWCPDCLSLTA